MFLPISSCLVLTSLIALILVTCSSFLIAYTLRPPHKFSSLRGKQWRMPPGPRGRPIVGSLLAWLHAKRDGGSMVAWLVDHAQYGEMTTLHMGTKTWVLLNSSRVVHEIITKRAGLTHERPYFPVASSLVSRGKRVFLLKTEDWKEGRRLLHSLINGPTSQDHGRLATLESTRMLNLYLTEPKEWYAHHYRYSVGIIHRIVTGRALQKSTAELNDLQRVTSTFLTTINSSFVEFFPQLQLLPKIFQFWRPHWEAIGTFHNTVFRHWWTNLKDAPAKETTKSQNFVQYALENYSGTEEDSMYLTMLIISAGSDNPRMTMNAFVMACLSAPTALAKARMELEHVCGAAAERLPSLNDLPQMPYMCAVVKEVLRWRPTVPLVPQRVLVQDHEFEGYRIPAGTEFLVNSIPVCRNGYDEPEQFRPERWLEMEKEGKRGAGVAQEAWPFAFSGGKRMCVGYKLAQKELSIAFARLLYCFDFSSTGPFDDKRLNAFSPGEPFPVKATVRSAAHEVLIRRELANESDTGNEA